MSFMELLSRLFRPLDYVRIKHPHKVYYDLYFPLILASFFTLLFAYLPVQTQIIGKDGLVRIITDILQILSGFYIASLAAIATFNKAGMDDLMEGEPPTLEVLYHGKTMTDKLTRRRFLCLLFGYLSLLSLFLYFLGAVSALLSANFKYLFGHQLWWLAKAKWTFVWMYLFLTSNLIITTLLGLFYMVDRIHRRNIIARHSPSNGNSNTPDDE
ncbi:MAG: hypothetical protein PHI06_09730 [Desulfobulbaceae bacterium]|nr:hypothetical protein [Desulfobulbaceae bacterium]